MSRIISGAMILSLLFWIFDSLIDSWFFHDLTFFEIAITSVPPHEFYTRVLGMAIILSSGVVIDRAFARRREAERFAKAALDGLQSRIAILDSKGKIEAVNGPWVEFSLSQNPRLDRDYYIGLDYLEICERAEGYDSDKAKEIGQGIEKVLSGELPEYFNDYVCNTDNGRWWYTLRVTPFPGNRSRKVVLNHEDITELRKAHEALLKSEEALRSTGELAQVGGWNYDLETGAMTWTDTTYRLHEVDPDYPVTGEKALEFYPEPHRAFMAQRFREAVIEGKPYDVEVETVTAKGNRRWIRVIGRPVYQGTRVRRVEGAIQDITARKAVEEEAAKIQERFQMAVSYAPFPMAIHAEDGEVILVNEVWERISGYTLENCPTVEDWTEKAYREEAPRIRKIIEELFESPSRVDVGEIVIRTASGEERTWDFSTVPLGSLPDGRRMLLTCAMDITLRKRAQVQNAWIASLVKNSKDICVIKDLDLRVVAANPALVRVAGKNSVEELLGKTDAEIFGIPEDRDPVRGYMEDERRARELEAGQFVDRIENVIFPDGKPRIFQTRKFPVFNDAGVLIATGNISTDITEKRRTEEQLRQAQKMESVGQLAGGVAHDFNNLLQAILGYAQLAAESLPESDPQLLEYFQHIRHCAEKAAAVTRQLLAFSRRQVLNPKYIDLNQIVGDLMKIVSRTLGEHIELKFIPQQDLHTVYVDPGQVEQIVLNLCVNSRDAMPEGGQLVIETGNRFLDEEYCRVHGWAKVGDYAVLTVSDTGEGMDAVTQNQIFDPFFTTKELGKGTGLGLATVYGIVAQHDGLIHVYSEVGRGTTFKVYFPAQGKKASTPTIRLEEKGPRGTERILLAEDDEAVRTLASKILEGAGYSVLVARNGEEARDLIDKHHAEIDIAILDVVMPKTSGKLVGDYFRSIRPGAHVLYSSGYTANAIQTGFQLEEGVDFLSKPYDPDDLLWKVRQVLDNQRE